MERSLIAATSGIEANQTYLDVIGNDIANANTTAFKSQSVSFADLLNEQVAGATAPTATSGGINPYAVGSGVKVGTVSENDTQGTIEQTNVPTDVAIQGNGYLIASQNGQTLYTRDGQLSTDANGQLVAPNGALIQGWMAQGGVVNTNAPVGNITIPLQSTVPATETTNITLGGNLPANSGSGTNPVSFTTDAYDSLGNTVPITVSFYPTSTAGQWTMVVTAESTSSSGTTTTYDIVGTPPTSSSSASGPTVTFQNGQLSGISGGTQNANGSWTVQGTWPTGSAYTFGTPTVDFTFPAPGSSGAVTQFAGNQSISATSQNGSPAGSLQSFSIGADGTITGTFSNGQSQTIGQIALATFANPQGLSDLGNLMYQSTVNSGQPVISAPGSGGAGTLVGGALEQSNVSLSKELTDLIVAQEAYQANTKVITTTDQAVQSLLQVP
jgi:flagellar hook protein FlgE